MSLLFGVRRQACAKGATALRRARRTAQALILLSAFGLLAPACGSADEPEDGPPQNDADRQYATYVSLYTHMVCDLVSRCCNALNQALYTLGGEQTCEAYVGTTAALSGLSGLGAVGTGRAVYHEDAQRACAEALASMTCEELEADLAPEACETPWFEGLIAEGETCKSSVECADGYCETPAAQRVREKDLIHLLLPPYPVSEAPDGACVALLPENVDCTSDSQCATGFCEDDRCVEGGTVLDALCPL
jgi:hypothetical protein